MFYQFDYYFYWSPYAFEQYIILQDLILLFTRQSPRISNLQLHIGHDISPPHHPPLPSTLMSSPQHPGQPTRSAPSETPQVFYAVARGRHRSSTGVYSSWSSAAPHVLGVSCAVHKKFSSVAEAQAFIQDYRIEYSSPWSARLCLPLTFPLVYIRQ